MQQDILIIGVLFPAILMMINFGNRYIVLANLIMHDTVVRDNTPPADAERFLLQIDSALRNRLRLIGMIQTMSASAFIMVLLAMVTTYLDMVTLASWMFIISPLL